MGPKSQKMSGQQLPTISPAESSIDMTKKNALELQEMLIREKKLLQNASFVNKLKDKGAKLQEKILKIEQELNKKLESEKQTKETLEKKRRRHEVEKLEWTLKLGASGKIENASNQESDDDEDEDRLLTEEEKILKMIATSQISQKCTTVITESASGKKTQRLYTNMSVVDFPDASRLLELTKRHSDTPRPLYSRPYSERLSLKNTDTDQDSPSPVINSEDVANTSEETPMDQELPGSPSERGNTPEGIKTPKTPGERHWDESLLPSTSVYKSVKALSLEESFDMTIQQSEKLKEQDEERHKKLAAIGWSNNYSIKPMKPITPLTGLGESFRPQRQPIDEDLEDEEEEDDSSDGCLSDESEDEAPSRPVVPVLDSDDDEEEETENNATTSSILSELVNSSMKLG